MSIAVFDYSTLEIGISLHDFGFSPHFTRCTRRRDPMCLPFRLRLLRARAHIGMGARSAINRNCNRITRSSCYQWNCCARWPERDKSAAISRLGWIWQSVVLRCVGAAIFIQILSHFTAHWPDRTAYFVGSAVHAVVHTLAHTCAFCSRTTSNGQNMAIAIAGTHCSDAYGAWHANPCSCVLHLCIRSRNYAQQSDINSI